MSNTPYILSLAYRNQIDKICDRLPLLGLKHMAMYIVFNDGSVFTLSNLYPILKDYYQGGLYKEDYTYTPAMIQPFQEGYYLCQNRPFISEKLKEIVTKQYHLYPIYNIIRHHSECTFIFSAIRNTPTESPQLFYERTIKKFETLCIQFIDNFLDLIITCNPSYRFSFILTNKRLRDAVIRQGYEQEISISMREKECLWHVMQGKSAKEIARSLNISPYTVEEYLKRIREVFNCSKMAEIMLECIHRGIIGNVNHFHKKELQFSGTRCG
ncbi:helix-turn-helix transcriptional regulator [Legionella spiritensis]|uniref:helix-turn-helix transcriptional regulator n=1 Tax=Legionella spiritensis TaxID=452 RepID=UPI000F71FFA1|nr:LuxR C-terminal-related transcriptional regulator [Legionella spiritensis]VEG92250.1 lipolytic enzyme / transcription regulator protein [Legionella spiritensis]